MINLKNKNLLIISASLLIILIALLFVYQSVFSLELEGDSWFYAWGHKIYYGSNVFSPLSLQGMRTSLGGASLTFGLIQNHFDLNPLAFYSISVILKFLSVVSFFFLIKKLTKSYLASFISSLLLAVTFTGVEATHWVFNMYAYIGLIFITWSTYIFIDLPENFQFKKWLSAWFLACLGVWYATLRTNGILIIIIVWSVYKVLTLKNKDSKLNLLSWVVGIAIFLLIDKFLLGQMESSYSQKYIIEQGIASFQSQVGLHKFDFLLSSATNLGNTILPDVTWGSWDFPKVFSFLGDSMTKSIILPSFLIFSVVTWCISSLISVKRSSSKKLISGYFSKYFAILLILTLVWTGIVYYVSKLGPLNFSSPQDMVATLFGGYVIITSLSLTFFTNIPTRLKDLFLIAAMWSVVFLLVPIIQNGGPIFGTYHRYMATTAPAISIFIAGLIALGFIYKNRIFQILVILIALIMIFNHAVQAKAYFDRENLAHNTQISAKIWRQFTQIVPNKPEYAKNPPAVYFDAADDRVDQDILFESLFYGYPFIVDLRYHWDHNLISGMYNSGNYPDLVNAVKKDPKFLDNFYAVKVENQSLINITDLMDKKILHDIKLQQ